MPSVKEEEVYVAPAKEEDALYAQYQVINVSLINKTNIRCVCVHVCVCVRACVRACVCVSVCVRASMSASTSMYSWDLGVTLVRVTL